MSSASEQLTAARSAYSDLLKGEAVRDLTDQNGERVTYSRADIPRLLNHIRQLEFEVANGSIGTMGPLRPLF